MKTSHKSDELKKKKKKRGGHKSGTYEADSLQHFIRNGSSKFNIRLT
jgi:hypothetical protein